MWQHQPGRIDFEEPLFRLLVRGWRFRECAPTEGAPDGGRWTVKAVQGRARVRVDHFERRDAWAPAVQLALRTAIVNRPPIMPTRSAPQRADL